MKIALAGLHGAGKTHLSQLIRVQYGWTVCVKRELLHRLHSIENPKMDWTEWYRSMYAIEGVGVMTQRILDLIVVNQETNLIIDSVHNLVEWNVIRAHFPDCILAFVVAPTHVRKERNEPEDTSLDLQRVRFWHEQSESGSGCLVAEAQWVFNGGASDEMLLNEFECLLEQAIPAIT